MITFEYRLYTLTFVGDEAPASLACLNRLGAQGWGAARVLSKTMTKVVFLLQRQKGTNKADTLVFDPRTFNYNK